MGHRADCLASLLPKYGCHLGTAAARLWAGVSVEKERQDPANYGNDILKCTYKFVESRNAYRA